MTLIYKLDPDIPKVNLHTKNELSSLRLSTVRALQPDRQTDTSENTHSRPNAGASLNEPPPELTTIGPPFSGDFF